MLNKKLFYNNLDALLFTKDIKIDAKKSEMLFKIMENDFTDKEFADACINIAKTECLYNKYPDPKLFYDRQDKISQDEERVLIKQRFLEKVTDYVLEDMPTYLNQSYSPGEMRILQMSGGLSQLWSEIHNNNGKIGYITSQLSKNFDDFYEVEKKTDNTLQLENNSEQSKAISSQIKQLAESKKV